MIRKRTCYFYPNPLRLPIHQRNPYISNLINGLEKEFKVINASNSSKLGILDLIRYTPRIKFAFFNFIENLPDMRFGIIQSIFLVAYILTARIAGVKIIWVMHNKLSHNKKSSVLKKLLFKILTRYSDLIFTHAREGIQFGKQFSNSIEKRIVFLQHPVDDDFLEMSESMKKEFDILIWGTMNEYKGVLEFLQNLGEENRLNSYTIKIMGYFSSPEYFEKVGSFKSEKIEVVNNFITDEGLNDMLRKTKIVLFPYNPDSILSSGALMSSLKSPAFLIGPHTASFADLADSKVIYTFKDKKDLIHLLDSLIAGKENPDNNIEIRKQFIQENTWPRITEKINKEIIERFHLNSA